MQEVQILDRELAKKNMNKNQIDDDDDDRI
jgi:hypothetical protein